MSEPSEHSTSPAATESHLSHHDSHSSHVDRDHDHHDRESSHNDRDRDRDRDHDRDRNRTGSVSGNDRDRGAGGSADRSDRPPPRKRQRVRLSCLECRRRKLSCDREFPCSRCLQSGTPERCEYETRPGLAPPNKLGLTPTALAGIESRLPPLSLPSTGGESPYFRKDARDSDRIRRLELEVAQLKSLLLKQAQAPSVDGSSTLQERSPQEVKQANDEQTEQEQRREVEVPPFLQTQETSADREELRFFRGKEFKTRYYGPASAFLAFQELSGLCPFMKETSEEWLRPLHIHRPKDRKKGAEERERRFREPDPELEALLPSKEETDNLVSIYLEQFEQVHRIVHIPSFRRDYAKFWQPGETRNAAFTALVLAMMGISSCLGAQLPHKFDKMVSSSHTRAIRWVQAVDAWQEKQSQKHRRLIHYQIACLVYLAKRINTMKKKRFWKNAGAMTQDAIGVGLHREPSHMSDKISPFNQEMRRRIWATIQSYDLQASFDHGLPSILCSLHFDVDPPRNIDDEEFDEDSKELPPSKPPSEYTFSSFQHLSRQSLPLRLELSRLLTGPPEELDYDRVIRYTNEINQEIDALPSWDVSDTSTDSSQSDQQGRPLKKPLLAYTLLHIQLRQYIIPLHQPFLRLRKTNSKYQYSEIIYYNAARDMVLLHDRLAQQGIRTLNFLREDSLTLAINLTSVTMLQPRGSTNMIMINSQHTLQLLEKCLAMKEDRILRCGNNEPWGYSIMCAAFGLLEAHLGTKTPEAAKAASAERFINLHYKLLAGQDPPGSQQSLGLGVAGCCSGVPQGSAPSDQQQHQQQGRGMPGMPYGPQLPNGSAGEGGYMRSKSIQSVTPFPPSSSQQGAVGGANQVEVPGTPWWMPNAADPSGLPQQIQPLNPEFNLETLGYNLNELWGSGNFDWDAMMP